MKHFKSVVYEQTLKYNAIPFPKVQIKSSEHAYQYALDILKHEVLECKEYFYAIYLNRANNTVSFAKISEGSISGTVVDVRLIMKHAIDSLASGIILVHNHPSCNVMSSAADNHVTNKIKQAAKLFDINVLDHIIIGNRNGNYFSYADEGKLN
jgi:DNA repair protein RadC